MISLNRGKFRTRENQPPPHRYALLGFLAQWLTGALPGYNAMCRNELWNRGKPGYFIPTFSLVGWREHSPLGRGCSSLGAAAATSRSKRVRRSRGDSAPGQIPRFEENLLTPTSRPVYSYAQHVTRIPAEHAGDGDRAATVPALCRSRGGASAGNGGTRPTCEGEMSPRRSKISPASHRLRATLSLVGSHRESSRPILLERAS